MFGLTSLGIIHTAISLVALGAGIVALIRDKRITWKNTVGKTYVITTIFTCVTSFGIFEHGGFGKAHVLGILTLIVIAFALLAENKTSLFGKLTPYIETVCYSLTFFFHWVPAITETSTRVPLGAPLASSPDDPGIKAAIGVCLVLFLIGTTLQVNMLRKKLKTI